MGYFLLARAVIVRYNAATCQTPNAARRAHFIYRSIHCARDYLSIPFYILSNIRFFFRIDIILLLRLCVPGGIGIFAVLNSWSSIYMKRGVPERSLNAPGAAHRAREGAAADIRSIAPPLPRELPDKQVRRI